MTREPVHKDGRLVGHEAHYPPVFITVRDVRGYDSIMQAIPARVVFEPVTRQRGMFDDD